MPQENKILNNERAKQENEAVIPEIQEQVKENLGHIGLEQKSEEFSYKQAVPQKSTNDSQNIQKEADKLREINIEGGKLERLLNLSKEKGPDFAISVAKKANDPCLLDLLHDKLIEKGLTEII